jgi:hypothetical protein
MNDSQKLIKNKRAKKACIKNGTADIHTVSDHHHHCTTIYTSSYCFTN